MSREGLKKLPYCPPSFTVITPNYLNSYSKQKEYVKKVMDMEISLGADILVAPYHYTHNTTVLPTYQYNPVEQWFDLDIKLLRESVEYKNSLSTHSDKNIYAGICINSNSLVDTIYKNDLLNYYTSTECDGYIVYADGIDKEVNGAILYHYLDTLLKLQKYTGRPVIAGRINPAFGLGALSLGIAGFSSGAARFETFSEEFYIEDTSGYNLFEKYYFTQLLGTIPIDKKLPTRLEEITNVLGKCYCKYCKGRAPADVIVSKNNKLHYLYWINIEVQQIRESFENKEDVLLNFITRVDSAITYYEKLKSVFKPENYKYLYVCKEVFTEFRKVNV